MQARMFAASRHWGAMKAVCLGSSQQAPEAAPSRRSLVVPWKGLCWQTNPNRKLPMTARKPVRSLKRYMRAREPTALLAPATPSPGARSLKSRRAPEECLCCSRRLLERRLRWSASGDYHEAASEISNPSGATFHLQRRSVKHGEPCLVLLCQ